ncbi:MAG: helix-turn-helix transcriptional regulator [Clostridiaceae bacterium]|nr:helix-turn-helix transcriptional regulator [Clostridiaceae bacterium]
MHYGDRIRFLRLNKGLSQAEMAEKVGKSLSAYKLWESGDNEPSISSLIFLADFFSVSLDFLIARPSDIERNAVTEFELHLVPNHRGDYIRLIEAIQKSLDYTNFPVPDLLVKEDEFLLKIESLNILADALNKMHSLAWRIDENRKYTIDAIDNKSKERQFLIDANLASDQIFILQQAFQDIFKKMLKYILELGQS